MFWPEGLTVLFLSFSAFLQLLRWTCRKPWPRPLRPVPKSVWYWGTPTAAGCPQPWPSSRVRAATAQLPPLPPPRSPVLFPHLASSRAAPAEPKLTWAAWGSWMAAIPWAGLCPERMNWTKGSTDRSSTTPWTDTAAVRRRIPSKLSPWRASPPPVSRRRLAGEVAPSYTSTSCKRKRHSFTDLTNMWLHPQMAFRQWHYDRCVHTCGVCIKWTTLTSWGRQTHVKYVNVLT